MVIYTSYFAQLRNLPDNVIPVAICLQSPEWYRGLQYKKLAPKSSFFKQWKLTHDNDYYIRCFKRQVLNKLDTGTVVGELYALCKQVCPDRDFTICLICYEKPEDFCHRHLVAEWLRANNYFSREWSKNKLKIRRVN